MNLTIEPQESCILARIEDARLDALSAPDFKARIAGALTGAAPKVVLDLSPVRFIDSAGLASILSLVKNLPDGGELRIAGAQEAVRAVFRLTRLDKVLPLHDTFEDAVAAMEAR
jgi:anti-sigma B factor antagonist